MLTVRTFSPFDYVASFTLPTPPPPPTSPTSQTVPPSPLHPSHQPSSTQTQTLPKGHFRIPLGSLNSFIFQTNSKTNSVLKSRSKSCERSVIQGNVNIILDYILSFRGKHDLSSDCGDIGLFVPELLLQHRQHRYDDCDDDRVDIFQITQSKLSQFLSLIDPMIQFHKKCSGKSQLHVELYTVEDLRVDPSAIKRGVVISDTAIIWTTDFGAYYFPENCMFYWGDIRVGLRSLCSLQQQHIEQRKHFSQLPEGNYKYETVVLDPPWRNRSARRGSKYQMGFSNKELLALGTDLQTLMSPKGCLVAVWVTNSNNFSFVKDTLFPKWGVQYLSVWWWLKVKVSGEALHNGMGDKKTYERIVIGYCGPHTISAPINCVDSFSLDINKSKCETPACELEGKRKRSYGNEHDNIESIPSEDFGNILCNETEDVILNPAGFFLEPDYLPRRTLPTGFSAASSYILTTNAVSSNSVIDNDKALFSSTHESTMNTTISQPPHHAVCTYRDSAAPRNETDMNETSLCFPVQVIVSVPVRHSWKPPLQHLLGEGLQIIKRFYSLADTNIGTADVPIPQEAIESPIRSQLGERQPCIDLEIFARYVF